MDEEESGLTLSIGAVSRATGVPANTLRTWERRYGFPKPLRTEGGQRAYEASIVPHLVEISRALERGLRPREALTASREELARWAAPDVPEVKESSALLEAARRMDGVALKRGLRMAWAERGGIAMMDDVVGPFVRELGDEWAAGRLEIYQEHFASEMLRGFLAEQWRPLSETAQGAVVLCATPAGEQHDLGLQFAATALALAGRRVRYLGANTPVVEILKACRQEPVEACAMSISVFADPAEMAVACREVRDGLPPGATLLIGGAGAPHLDGVVRLESLAALFAWARPGG